MDIILDEFYKELLSAYDGREIPLIDNIVSGKFYTGVSLSDGSLGISYNFITGGCSNIEYLNGQNPFDVYKKVENDVLKIAILDSLSNGIIWERDDLEADKDVFEDVYNSVDKNDKVCYALCSEITVSVVKHDIYKIIEQFEKASEVNFIEILKDGFEKPETVADSTVLYMDTSVLSVGLPDDAEEKKAVVLFGPSSLIPEPLTSRGIIYAPRPIKQDTDPEEFLNDVKYGRWDDIRKYTRKVSFKNWDCQRN